MTVYEAISDMRRRSESKQPFAFSFMSYSITRNVSEGEVSVEHALLMKNSKSSKNAYQEFMLTFLDCDTGQTRQCWQPLLMSYQYKPLTSID